MAARTNGGIQLSALTINELLGNHIRTISENDLHDGIEWLKAKMKKEVEENTCWTKEYKELVKSGNDFFLNSVEHEAKSYLKSRNRLL